MDGFVKGNAAGTGSDAYAAGYYLKRDLPFIPYAAQAYTLYDRWFCSIMDSTYPNRHYQWGAQDGGTRGNQFPSGPGFHVGDDLRPGDRPRPDRPLLLLRPPVRRALRQPRRRLGRTPCRQFYTDAAAGRLPNIAFVDPSFVGEEQGTSGDEHPHGDIRVGQAFMSDVVHAFMESPQYRRGVLFIDYDEWGGFFDHVKPRHVPDAPRRPPATSPPTTASPASGSPGVCVSPFSRRGGVNHMKVTHESILKLISYRWQLGHLNRRHRYATNIGRSLDFEHPRPRAADAPRPDRRSPGRRAPPAARRAPRLRAPEAPRHGQARELGPAWSATAIEALRRASTRSSASPTASARRFATRRPRGEAAPEPPPPGRSATRWCSPLGVAVGAVGLVAGAGGLVQTSTSNGTPDLLGAADRGRPAAGRRRRHGRRRRLRHAAQGLPRLGRLRRDQQAVDGAARAYLLRAGRAAAAQPSLPRTAAPGQGSTAPAAAQAGPRARHRRDLALQLQVPRGHQLHQHGRGAGARRWPTPTTRPIAPTLKLYQPRPPARGGGVLHHRAPGQHPVRALPDGRQPPERRLQGLGRPVAQRRAALAPSPYKSGERAKIESQGYRIVANVGDQESDLQGGHADRAFKLPNPYLLHRPLGSALSRAASRRRSRPAGPPGELRGRSGPGPRRGARRRRVERGAVPARGRPAASPPARRHRRRPSAIAIAATTIAAPGTSQAVRSKPDFDGSARTSVPYWATSSSLIWSLVLPAAISLRMKARSRSACGEKERLRAVPHIGHITSSSTSGRVVFGGAPALDGAGAMPRRRSSAARRPGGEARASQGLIAWPRPRGRGRRSRAGTRRSPGRGCAGPACPAGRPGTTPGRRSSRAGPRRSRRCRREAADR